MATILTNPDDLNLVRAAIDPLLTSDELPDAAIGLSIILDAADLEIKRLAPDWASYTAEPEATHLKNAAAYLTAALVAETLPAVVSEAVGKGDHSYRVNRPSPAELAAILRSRARSALALATGAEEGSDIPTLFTLASAPCRVDAYTFWMG